MSVLGSDHLLIQFNWLRDSFVLITKQRIRNVYTK